MNIFQEFEDIAGLDIATSTAGTLQAFFTLAGEIRTKLNNKAYLLDRYVSFLLAAANETLCSDAANLGFISGGALRHICRDALSGADGNHPVFAKAHAYLAANPLPFQEPRTNTAILMVAMIDEYVKTATRTFLEDQDQKLLGCMDIVRLSELYREITGLLGGEALMERLNLLIRQRFFAVPVMAAYLQGLTDDLVYCLSHRDVETSRQVFQLILDLGIPMGAEDDDR